MVKSYTLLPEAKASTAHNMVAQNSSGILRFIRIPLSRKACCNPTILSEYEAGRTISANRNAADGGEAATHANENFWDLSASDADRVRRTSAAEEGPRLAERPPTLDGEVARARID